jgi:hypothetical protein
MTMWIGSIRLRVRTKDVLDAGTDNLVSATIVRDGVEIKKLLLDYPSENDLERGAIRNYDYIGPTKLQRNNDKTPELPPDIGQIPMPYPSYGLEFSNGLEGHLTLRLRIGGDDMWIKDSVELYIREIRLKATSSDTLEWQEDTGWTFIGTWSKDVAMSTDSSEGFSTLHLNLA